MQFGKSSASWVEIVRGSSSEIPGGTAAPLMRSTQPSFEPPKAAAVSVDLSLGIHTPKSSGKRCSGPVKITHDLISNEVNF